MSKLLTGLTLSQKASIGSLILGAIVAILSFKFLGPENNWTYYSVVLSTATILLFDKIARFDTENVIAKKLDDHLDPKNLKYIGTGVAGIEWLRKNTEGLVQVDNTVLRDDDDRGFVAQPSMEDFYSAFQVALNNNCQWRDVIFPGNLPRVVEMLDKTRGVKISRYFASEVAASVPLLQMMILRYPDRQTLLFGWNYKGSDSSRLFMCSDPEIVSFFATYFESMYKSGQLRYRGGEPVADGRPVAGTPSRTE